MMLFARRSVEGASRNGEPCAVFFKTLLLLGTAAGPDGSRCKNLFRRKVTINYPEEKTPQSRASAACMRCAAIRTARNAASPASSARRCARRSRSRSSPDVSSDGTRRTTRYDIDLFKCIYCGFCEEACPVDAIVETRLHEYHMENRGENIMSKDKLLGIGERYEAMIAADRAADARYR